MPPTRGVTIPGLESESDFHHFSWINDSNSNSSINIFSYCTGINSVTWIDSKMDLILVFDSNSDSRKKRNRNTSTTHPIVCALSKLNRDQHGPPLNVEFTHHFLWLDQGVIEYQRARGHQSVWGWLYTTSVEWRGLPSLSPSWLWRFALLCA